MRCSKRSTRRCRSIRFPNAVFRFPVGEGAPLHLLHEHARVTATRYSEDACEVEAMVPESILPAPCGNIWSRIG